MQKLVKVVFVIIYTKMLFLIPLSIVTLVHSKLYPLWLTYSTHKSDYYTKAELLANQKIISERLFSKTPLPLDGNELAHAIEVVGLTHTLFIFTFIGLFLLFIFFRKKSIREFFKSFIFRKYLTLLYLGPMLLFFIIGTGFFERGFILFHTLVFKNDWWLLDRGDLLINIFPPLFFQHMFLFILTVSLLFYIVSITISNKLFKKYDTKI